MAKQLINFRDDGWTHGSHVYRRGQQLEVDTELYPHFLLGPDEQIAEFGRVFFKLGAWDGALYDTADPDLTVAQKTKLEKANQEILEARAAEQKLNEIHTTLEAAATEKATASDTTRRRTNTKTE